MYLGTGMATQLSSRQAFWRPSLTAYHLAFIRLFILLTPLNLWKNTIPPLIIKVKIINTKAVWWLCSLSKQIKKLESGVSAGSVVKQSTPTQWACRVRFLPLSLREWVSARNPPAVCLLRGIFFGVYGVFLDRIRKIYRINKSQEQTWPLCLLNHTCCLTGKAKFLRDRKLGRRFSQINADFVESFSIIYLCASVFTCPPCEQGEAGGSVSLIFTSQLYSFLASKRLSFQAL